MYFASVFLIDNISLNIIFKSDQPVFIQLEAYNNLHLGFLWRRVVISIIFLVAFMVHSIIDCFLSVPTQRLGSLSGPLMKSVLSCAPGLDDAVCLPLTPLCVLCLQIRLLLQG